MTQDAVGFLHHDLAQYTSGYTDSESITEQEIIDFFLRWGSTLLFL
jgi:hypothetical protein